MDTLIFILQQMMNFSIPLLIVALGGMFTERSGVINIGLDGMMIMGALAGCMFISFTEGTMLGQSQLIIAVLISIVVGIIFSMLHAVASVSLKSNQIISGQALNMFAPAFAVFISRLFLGEQMIQFKNTFIVNEVPVLSKIPLIGDVLFQRVYITTYIGFAILIIASIVLYKTKFGLRLRACGEHPQAPDSVGINVYKMRYAGVLISGALAGLGGLIYVLPNSTSFNATVSGYGFLALGVMILGQWTPIKIFISAFFFGIMKTFSATYSGIELLNSLNIPSNIYKMLPYVITLIILMLATKRSCAPKAGGKPFIKGSR